MSLDETVLTDHIMGPVHRSSTGS